MFSVFLGFDMSIGNISKSYCILEVFIVFSMNIRVVFLRVRFVNYIIMRNFWKNINVCILF